MRKSGNIVKGLKTSRSFMGKRFGAYFIAMSASNMVGSLCYNIVLSLVFKDVINAAEEGDISILHRAFLLAAVSTVVALIVEPLTNRVKSICIRDTFADIKTKISKRILAMDAVEYEEKSAADFYASINQDITVAEKIYTTHIPNLVFAIFHGGIAMTIMMILNIKIAIVLFAFGAAQLWVNSKLSKKIEKMSEIRRDSYSKSMQCIVDLFDGLMGIRTSHSKPFFISRYKGKVEKYCKDSAGVEKIRSYVDVADNIFAQIGQLLVLLFALFFVKNNVAKLGTIIAIIGLQGNAEYLFLNYSDFVSGFSEALPSLMYIDELLNAGETSVKKSDTYEDEVRNTEDNVAIKLKGIDYRFPNGKKLFSNLNIEIEKGKFTVIAGETGCGKSTLIKILLGLYKYQRGEYYLDGQNVKGYDADKLSNNYAYADQHSQIFSMSIMDNLRIFSKEVSDEEIIEICKKTGVDEFVRMLDGKYEYRINDRKDNISGGQRQRLSITEMLLSDRDILLIDEGLANLDEPAAREILKLILSYCGNKTVVMVTHSRWICEYADKVIYI